jgi:hypothetical protein
MASQRKAVIVRKFSKEWSPGYAAGAFSEEAGELELLDMAGKVLRMPWEGVKWVCYVRELSAGSADPAGPERLMRKRFTSRPRTPGLWLRLMLLDGDEIEGLAANDRSLIDGAGLLLTPPDVRSNAQRLFIPRKAIQTLEVMGLIGVAQHRRLGDERPQPGLFPEKTDAS